MPAPSGVSSRYTRALSPPLSSSQSFTAQGQPKLNVVTRLAIEGKAAQGEQGAAIKMYLKIALPLDSVTPGSTIPLFPEDNIKILASQVHPIDGNSVPYNFSSSVSPMLHNAARTLMLPARSPNSYLSLFGLTSAASGSSMSSSSRYPSSPSSPSNGTLPLEDKYTGHIQVSGYHVSFVLPKEFPPRSRMASTFGGEHESTPTSYKNRRLSFGGEKNVLQFMAAVELMVPLTSRPPRAPYLLSIPTPRCLSNHIKLRIFPPTTTSVSSASFASLSSAEDDSSSGTWDLTSDPHVTRSSSSTGAHLADDESSDDNNYNTNYNNTNAASTGCGIQGTFPSAERIRIRWATPSRAVDVPSNGLGGGSGGDGRRKVGVREVRGEMTCVVLRRAPRQPHSVVMHVEYKGTCKGVWFPGVATLLGMDVALVARGADVTWVSGTDQKWTVGGGQGYTGWDVAGAPSITTPPLPMAMDATQVAVVDPPRQRYDSTSLLRAPLPAAPVAEYSFEGSGPGSGSGSGSVASSALASLGGVQSHVMRPPVIPLTIHVNMNDLLPPSKNVFTFTIAGTVLVVPKSRAFPNDDVPHDDADSDMDADADVDADADAVPEPVTLPHFTVLAADTETTTLVVRNDVAGATVEVYTATGDVRDAQTRKTVLQRGGATRCAAEGERIAVRTIRGTLPPPLSPASPHMYTHLPRELTTPLREPRTPMSARALASGPVVRRRRDGPLMIPAVHALVTPLPGDALSTNADAYAVRVTLPAPDDEDTEWLEFGFAMTPSSPPWRRPRVEIASVSVDGVPARVETTSVARRGDDDDVDAKDGRYRTHTHEERVSPAGPRLGWDPERELVWIMWAKVHLGSGGGGGGAVEVNYVCTGDLDWTPEDKRPGSTACFHALVPAFLLPIGRLEVRFDLGTGLEIEALDTSFKHQLQTPTGPRFIHHSANALFIPRLSLELASWGRTPSARRAGAQRKLTLLTLVTLSIALLGCGAHFGREMYKMRRSLEGCSTVLGAGWNDDDPSEMMHTFTTTVTTTVLAPGHSPWWFTDKASPAAGATTTFPGHPKATITALPEPHPTSTVISESETLSLIHAFPFSWPFPLPPHDIAMDSLMRGLHKFWELFRKAYHYPLPPP